MTKITGQTTLAELMVARGKLGITRMSFDFSCNGETLHAVRFTAFGTEGVRVVGTGATEIEALDDGLARLWHREAEAVAHHQPTEI